MLDYALAADLGGTNIRMAAVSRDGAILSHAKRPTPDGVTGEHLAALLRQMSAECRDTLSPDSQLVGLSIGVPAPAPSDFDGVLTKLPNIHSLEGVNLRDILLQVVEVPITIENDATAAAIGEHWLGATRGVDNSICVTLGTGIGGGLILNGKPWRGPDGTGGEIGHICVETDGHPCGCGSNGCVEQYASAQAIVRLARGAGLEVETAEDVYKLWLDGSHHYEGGVDALRGRGGSLHEESEIAASVFKSMARYLGIVLAGLVNTLNPDRIVICGGVSGAWDAFAPHLKAEIAYRAYEAPARRATIVRGRLGDNAGILGAARSAFLLATD